MIFQELGLAEPIVRAVAAEGYTTPTPIQREAIPHALAGADLLGCAQTGTGKTAAFALPILHRLGAHAGKPNAHGSKRGGTLPRALILCPTRELASQIGESFRTYGGNLNLRGTVIFGGVGQNPQVNSLRRGVDIIVATPGRLLDLMNQGHVNLSAIEILVLDEADQMLDMGFIPDIRRIIKQLPPSDASSGRKARQTMLFSATMPPDIRQLADTILVDPISLQVTPVASTVDLIAQSVYHVPKRLKAALLESLLITWPNHRTLVFTRTKHGADKVVKELTKAGIRASAIHGNKSQNARTSALDSFKSKTPPVLVATDIASRGIDVDQVTHVINFDMPVTPEAYVHRIGRTARAGASGSAISFCDPEERGLLRAIERLTRVKIAVNTDQAELTVDAPANYAEPTERRRSQPPVGPASRRGGGGSYAGNRGGFDPRGKQSGRSKQRTGGRPAPKASQQHRAANGAVAPARSNADGGMKAGSGAKSGGGAKAGGHARGGAANQSPARNAQPGRRSARRVSRGQGR